MTDSALKETALAPIRLLIIEDNPDDAQLLLREVTRAGIEAAYEVVETENKLREALGREPWDLVISDYTLRGFTGLAVIDAVQEVDRDLPVLIVSGTTGEEMAVEAMRRGARDYILKDRTARLVPAIRRELRESKNRRARRDAEERVVHLQKMDAIGRLAGGIAHDFNNMLAAVTIYCDLSIEGLKPDDELARNLREIKKLGERGAGLTRQLLLFSRHQIPRPRNMALGRVVADLASMFRRVLGANIELDLKISDDPCALRGDPSQLELVVLNLVLNARDAMPLGGRLTIETAVTELAGDIGSARMPSAPGRYVMLRVTDTGRGMDRAVLERIFEPFFTTKPMGKGAGLGLSTVYGIVRESGGTISVRSMPGQGSEFVVFLPNLELPMAEPETAASSPRTSPESCTVLVVEDELQLRDVVCSVLRAEGYRVIAASSGADALRICATEQASIDLLLTDVVMPDIGGFALMTTALGLRKGLRVLYMSGYADGSVSWETAPGGGVRAHLLEKPFTAETLRTKVKEALDAVSG